MRRLRSSCPHALNLYKSFSSYPWRPSNAKARTLTSSFMCPATKKSTHIVHIRRVVLALPPRSALLILAIWPHGPFRTTPGRLVAPTRAGSAHWHGHRQLGILCAMRERRAGSTCGRMSSVMSLRRAEIGKVTNFAQAGICKGRSKNNRTHSLE